MAGMPMPDDLYKDKSYKLVITTVVSFVLATTGIVGRFAARLIVRKRLELNDYLILLGFIMKLGLMCLSCFLISYGIGKHVYILPPGNITHFLQATWTGSFVYAPTIMFIKLSILSLYYVAFPSRFMKLSVWILAGITTAWGIALCLTGLLACVPIARSWEPQRTDGHCINLLQYYWGLQIPNIVTDFIILFLPFRDIYMLHLPSTQLLQIAGVLSLGLVTCAIDIVRLVVFLQLPASLDITWVDLAPSMWLDLEASIAILCACLPIMRPLLHPRRFYDAARKRGTTMTDGGEGGGYEEVHSQAKNSHAVEMSSELGSRSGTSSSGKLRHSGGSSNDAYGKGYSN
ncbi:MAG: hypothetical protein Q9159_006152 [Coniocarpon cinnabarinum]